MYNLTIAAERGDIGGYYIVGACAISLSLLREKGRVLEGGSFTQTYPNSCRS